MIWIICIALFSFITTAYASTEFLTVYNPFTGKMDYYTLNASYVNCADIHGNTSSVCSPSGAGEENLAPLGDYLFNNTASMWVNASKIDQAITNKSYVNQSQLDTKVNKTGDVMTGDLNITGNLKSSGYIDMIEMALSANPAANILRIFAFDFHGFEVLKVLDSRGMDRQLLRDSVFTVKNEGTITIPAMSAVYDCGSSGNVPLICLAQANGSTTAAAIGITTAAITSGSFGQVMQVGLLENVNTNAFNEGQIVYVSDTVPGGLTTTPPVTPNLTTQVGTILIKGVGNGAIQVISRAVTGLEFGTINDYIVQQNLTANGNEHRFNGTVFQNGMTINETCSAIVAGSYVPYTGATGDVNLGVNDLLVQAMNSSYIYSLFGIGGMDIRADPWYLGGAGLMISGDFLPNMTLTYSLGSVVARWNAYLGNVSTDYVTVGHDLNVTGDIYQGGMSMNDTITAMMAAANGSVNNSINFNNQNAAWWYSKINTSVDLKLFEYNKSIKSWTNGTITDKMKDSNNSANNSINFNNQNGAWWIAFVRTMENKNTTGWGIENNSVSYYLDWADINATIDERDEVGAPGSGEENLAPIGDYLNNNSASVWVNSSKILEQVTNQSYITIATANASITDKLKDHNSTTQNNSENFAGQNRLWWLNGINNSLNFNGQTAAYYLVLYNASMTDKLKDHNGTTQNNSENLGGQNSVWWAAKINTSVDLKLFEYNKSIKDYINVSVDQKLFEYNKSIKGHINTSIDQKLFEYNKSIKDWTNKTIADKIKDVNNSINNTINFNQQSASWWLNGINNSLNFGSQTAAYYFSLYNNTYVKINATNSGNINVTGYNVTYVNCITFLSGGDIC